ncbi:TPA: hypothetical protein ACSK8S_002328 [Listeria innocua]
MALGIDHVIEGPTLLPPLPTLEGVTKLPVLSFIMLVIFIGLFQSIAGSVISCCPALTNPLIPLRLDISLILFLLIYSSAPVYPLKLDTSLILLLSKYKRYNLFKFAITSTFSIILFDKFNRNKFVKFANGLISLSLLPSAVKVSKPIRFDTALISLIAQL